MNGQLHETAVNKAGRNERGAVIGGIVLIAAGLILLIGQLVQLDTWILVLLGMLFTTAGLAAHSPAWLIPGGVLNGIGLGATLIEYNLVRGEQAEGGAFLLAFALGWASIYLLSRLISRQPLTWTLFPAGVMALIGAPLLAGGALGEAALETIFLTASYVWPLALVAVGVTMLLRRRKS